MVLSLSLSPVKKSIIIITITTLVLAGCSSQQPRKPIAHTPTQAERPIDMPCPLGISDATVFAEDVPGGIAVTLTSITHTEELRVRLSHASKQYGPLGHAGLGHDGKHGEGHRHGLRLTALMRWASITYEDVPAGAKLRISTISGSALDVDRVRVRVRERVLDVASRPCEGEAARLSSSHLAQRITATSASSLGRPN